MHAVSSPKGSMADVTTAPNELAGVGDPNAWREEWCHRGDAEANGLTHPRRAGVICGGLAAACAGTFHEWRESRYSGNDNVRPLSAA